MFMDTLRKNLFFVFISCFFFFSSVNSTMAGMIGVCECTFADDTTCEEELFDLTVEAFDERCEAYCEEEDIRGHDGGGVESRVIETRCEGGEIIEDGHCVDDPATTKTEAEKSTVKAIELDSPIEDTEIAPLIGRIIKTALGVVGAVALLMFVYGGLIWLTSGGSPDKIKKGMDVLIWAAIGLVVIFAGYTLVDFVFTALGV